ncbi:MAG: LemA family protein [Candidatus Rokuibacteriota bacterium]|nr:MAG: LemA family protein [Candidatus Rokubacteria bacterium]
MDASSTTLGIVLVVVVGVLLWVIAGYNKLVRGRNRVREAWSGIDIQLRRRASLVPNLVDTVRGYATHERKVFEEVTLARGALQQARGAAAAAGANTALSQALGHLFAVAEAYPQLRASESFTGLQRDLGDAEDKVAFSRQFYNRNVLGFNTWVESFPGNLIASALGFLPAEYFETTGEGRAEVKLDLSTGRRERAPETPPPSPT